MEEKQLKDIDLRLVGELLKNSKRSDRQLAKALGVSQPTVTRRRTILEERVLDGYIAIPKLEKLDFQILAFIFFKHAAISDEYKQYLKEHKGVLMAMTCRGPNYNTVCTAAFKTYNEFFAFLKEIDPTCSATYYVVNVQDTEKIKPFGLENLLP